MQCLQHLTAMLHLAVKRKNYRLSLFEFQLHPNYINLLLENWNRDFALLASERKSIRFVTVWSYDIGLEVKYTENKIILTVAHGFLLVLFEEKVFK